MSIELAADGCDETLKLASRRPPLEPSSRRLSLKLVIGKAYFLFSALFCSKN